MKLFAFSSLVKPFAFAGALLVTSSAVFAGPVGVTFDYFGDLSAATFGGTGIPNDNVAVTSQDDVTLGLTATARYANPSVTNDGAGTFYASIGGDSPATYARWNFDFYANNSSASTVYLRLLWDLNPGVDTDVALLGDSGVFSLAAGATAQNSWNLGMGFLGGGFNPSQAGEYSFALLLTDSVGEEIARTSINVNVANNVPDAASTSLLTLAGFGLFAAAAGVRRRVRSASK